ncbi:hypothetical protein HNP02_000375 [Mycobacterium sp. AZCC_0083]|nr:hypothetical protein [Mycobacterium sp. AZCC_0083]
MAESHPKTYQCEHVDLDFIASAPFRFVSTVDLAITPEQLFEVLADAESWPHWATLITKVVWTSPEPRSIGTTRTVSMRGNIVGDEEFIAWEPFSHMAFRFNQSTSNALSAFAEDYRVVPNRRRLPSDLGDGDETERRGRPARHDLLSAGDGVAVPALPAQPAPLHRRALRDQRSGQYRPDHAERLTASGSATVSSRAERMTRVRRSCAS